jgi:hypothetical protein
VNVFLIEYLGALCLRENKIEEEEEAEPRVKRDPNNMVLAERLSRGPQDRWMLLPDEDEPNPRFSQQSARQHHPVHEPWR